MQAKYNFAQFKRTPFGCSLSCTPATTMFFHKKKKKKPRNIQQLSNFGLVETWCHCYRDTSSPFNEPTLYFVFKAPVMRANHREKNHGTSVHTQLL